MRRRGTRVPAKDPSAEKSRSGSTTPLGPEGRFFYVVSDHTRADVSIGAGYNRCSGNKKPRAFRPPAQAGPSFSY